MFGHIITKLYDLLANHLELMVTALLGLLGMLILRYDLRARRDLHQEDLNLKRLQYEADRGEREERLKWLARETLRLSEISTPLAKRIGEMLRADTQWAVDALERAKLGTHSATLFGDRSNHFREEKEHLAAGFAPLLMARCKRFIEEGRSVYLLLDSGTTICPLFIHIGQAAIRCHANQERWIEKLTLVTNSLPGVNRLMESGRLDLNNRYSPLAVRCELLPGEPLAVYSAVTGEKANQAICAIRKEARDAVFIGLVTGNWIRLPQSQPSCPIPLARGKGHLELKNAMIAASDEVYVISPLGKIFANVDLEVINKALHLVEDNLDPESKPYSEVCILEERKASVKLVSTSRPRGFVLSDLSFLVREHLKFITPIKQEQFVRSNAAHVLFPFTKLPKHWYHQVDIEFPHSQTRREEFMSAHFSVPTYAEREALQQDNE